MMATLGLPELERYELIEGELVQKVSKSGLHSLALMRLCNWLRSVFGEDRVFQEPTIDVGPGDIAASAPEPDSVVIGCPPSQLANHARPEQIRLIIEVSSTTLSYDLTTKARLYARACITDYWVLDLKGRRMLVHRDPNNGSYASVMAFSEEEAVSPLAAPTAEIRVASLF